jgi:hypothetical protein
MIWFLLVPVVFVYAFKEFVIDDIYGFLDRFMGFFMALLITVLAAGMSAGAACLVGLAFATHPVKSSEHVLVALRDKDGVQGTFFLGTGSIKGDTYYFYYYQLSDGGLQADKIYAGDGVRVYEEARQDAKLVTFRWELNEPWAWVISIPVRDGGYSYEFYVPTGTIRRGFTM